MTSLGNKKKRDAVRQAWMGTGRVSPYPCLVKITLCCLHWELKRLLYTAGAASLRKLETDKGVIARFVIGRRFVCWLINHSVTTRTQVLFLKHCFFFLVGLCSANKGDSMDKSIDAESSQTDDFIILVCGFWLVVGYYLEQLLISSPVLVWGAWPFNVFFRIM